MSSGTEREINENEVREDDKPINDISQYRHHGNDLVSDDHLRLQWFEVISNGRTADIKALLRLGADVNWEDGLNGTALHLAARSGHKEAVDQLIACGASVNSRNYRSKTAIYLAAEQGHKEVVSLLLCHQGTFNFDDDYTDTALHAAVDKGHYEIVELLINQDKAVDAQTLDAPLRNAAENGYYEIVDLLINKGATVDARDEYLQTALSLAAEGGHKEVVLLLLHHKATVDSRDRYSNTALHMASLFGHQEVVDLLIERGAAVDARNESLETALFLTAERGDKEIALLLLHHKAAVDSRDRYSNTALHKATQKGHQELVDLLIKHGAAVDAPNIHSQTSLHLAVMEKYEQIVRLLLIHGASFDLKDDHSNTALRLAVGNRHKNIISQLSASGANLNEKSTDGNPLLAELSKNGDTEMAALLLDLGADIHATNLNGQTSLMIAVTAAEHSMVSLLLKRNASINAVDNDSLTALHYSARGGHYALLKLLLHYKADIEAKAKHDDTALHLAAEYNYPDIVAALIHKKANVDAKNEKRKSPIEVAISKGHVDIVYQLKDAGAIIGKASDTILSLLNLAADAGQVALIKRTLDTIDKEEERRSYKNTSLHRSSQHGQIDVVAYLLENGADIESRNEDGLSPLFLAGPYPEVVSFLIHRGACITARNTYSFKETALHHYTSLGHIEAVRLLLNCDSNIHISDRLGNTALHIAARIGHCEISDILLRQGVDINAKNDEGETALHAATRHRSLDLAKLLIDFDIDIDAQTFDAKATALHYAMNMDNLKLVSLLVKRHANVNITDMYDRTALHIAAIKNLTTECALLIKHKANTNFMDHCGMTPLLLAAQNWNPKLVGLLLNCESFDCKPASTQSLANVIRWYPPKEDYNLLRNFLSVIKLFIEAGFDLTDIQRSMDWLEWLYPMLRDMLTEPSNHQLKKKWSRDLDSSSIYEEDDVDIKGDEVSCPLIKLTNDFDDGLNISLHIEETYHYVWHKYGVGFPQFKRLQLPMTSIIDESQYQSNTAEEPSFSQKLGTSHIENRFTTIIQSLMNCVCARFITSDNSFMLELDLDTSSDINSPKWASHFDKMNGIIREPGRLIVQIPSNYTNLSVPGWHKSDLPYLRFVDAVYVCRRSSTWVDQEIFSDVLGGSEQKMATNLHAILIAGLSILSIVGDDSLVEKLVMAILGVPLDPMRNPLPNNTSAQWDVRNRRQCPCDSQSVHRPLSPVAAAKAVGADIWRDRHQYNVNRVWDLHQDTLVANIDVGNVVFVTHRWSDPEINYQDWVERKRSNKQIVSVSEMSDKLRRIRDTLLQHTQYVWMDTICIDKSSLSELDEVIRSMYKWYASCAAVVLDSGTSLDVWRSRGWCLQEGAAAGVLCGISKSGNLATIQELAMEQNQELCTLDLHLYYRLGNAAEVLARMDARNTTREEDMAYALAGIFSIDLTLAYGEGLQSRARLLHQLAIQKGDFSFISFHTNQTTLTNYLPATGQPIYLIAKCTRASSPVTVSHFGMCFEAQLVKGDDAIQLLQKLNNWIKMSFAKGRFQGAEELIEAGKQIEPESSSSVELAIVHDIRSLILVQVYGHDRQTGGGKPIKLCYRLQCCQIEEAEFDRLFTWNAGKVKKSAATLDETSLEEGRQAKVLNDDDSKSDVKLERIWLGDEPDSAELHQFESGQIGRNGRKRQRKM